MHVGVFTYYYYPIINGVVITIGDWKSQAKQSGVDMTVFTSQADWKKSNQPDVVEYPAIPLYKKIGITIPMFPETTIENEIRRRHITLFHVHHPFYIGKLALKMKKKFHIPVVFTYHIRYSDYFRSYLPWVSGTALSHFVTKIMVNFINKCDAVTAANETLKQELLQGGVRTPIFVVPPGIDTVEFASGNRRVARQRLGIDKDDMVLLYVGRLAREKNIYFLVRAFSYIHKKAPKIKLLLAGNGLEETKLKEYARKHKFANNVLFATNENIKTIPDIYAVADSFVYASQTETYGRVIVEAMAAGLCVIALKGPSIIDLLQDGVTGRIVFKHSPKVFAQRVLELMSDREKRLFLASNGQKEARQKYDSKVSWSQLMDVYKISEMSRPETNRTKT